MGRTRYSVFILSLLLACASSNVRFIQIDESYLISPKPADAYILLRSGPIERPHRVIGVIEVELREKARRVELDGALLRKAREIGADGLMLVEYDVDREVYLERHGAVVGRGPWRRHVVRTRKSVEVKKTASAVAVVFE
jgi:hypothetical protein